MSNSRSFVGSLSRAWQSLSRRPAYFAIAVSSLAIALGLATTVIAQIDSLMHPFTPIRDVDRMFTVRAKGAGTSGAPSRDDAQSALLESGLFESVAAIETISGELEIGAGLTMSAYTVTPRTYFDILGVVPRLGRLFESDESFESGVAVVTDRFWRMNFGNPATLDGASFRIGGQTFQIVGVLAPEWNERVRGEVEYGGALRQGLFIPPSSRHQPPRFLFSSFVARAKPGVEMRAADSVFTQMATRWRNQFGIGRPTFHVEMSSMRPDPLRIRGFQRALIAAAIFILVIASANVGALALARGVTNRRDQALRLALGAERRDLLRDVTAEVTILAVAGGIGGVLIAYASMGVMMALTPVDLAWLGFARPNWSPRVFAGLFAAVLASVGLCALGPAWYVSRIAPAEPLKEASGTSTGRAASRFKILIVGELSLAMVLLFGASLIAKTAHRVATFPFGYEPRGVVRVETTVHAVAQVRPATTDTSSRVRRRPEMPTSDVEGIVERLRRVPGVRDAAWFSVDMPERGIVISEASSVIDSILYRPDLYNVGAGFLKALGVAVVEGRDFVPGDAANGAIILDQRSAQRLFPDGSPIGRMVKLGPLNSSVPWMHVVGVAEDAVHELPPVAELDPTTVIYVSRTSLGFRPTFMVRGDDRARDIAPIATRLVKELTPPGTWVHSVRWAGNYEALLAGRRFTAGIFAALSLASLALATAGLFGVLSYAVSERMREFSLRVALGAQKANLLRLVFRDSFVMALGGTAIGGFAGLYLGFEVWDWLWGVYPVDATALVIAELVLLAVTFGASTIPALRATRANPADVMRAL